MPELPEVEAVRRRLERETLGARIVDVEIRRTGSIQPQTPAEFRNEVRGASVIAVTRRAKHLFVHLSNQHSLHIHLRMTGNLYVLPDHRFPPVSARILFPLCEGRALVFEDPRCLGRVHVHPTYDIQSILPPLGPEPLDEDFQAQDFVGIARRSRQPAKSFLLDQSQIAGLGNIYAAEALFEARVNPATPVCELSSRKLATLYRAIRQVLTIAIPCCERAYAKPGTFVEADEYPTAVYGREGEPCLRCRKIVARITQNGRSTYFCPHCQRRVL